jgi:ATP-dependent RNA helicase DDX21
MFPVQEETFRLIEAGKDVLASDRTGSGKTLGYTLPVLEKFNKSKYNLTPIKAPKFLILCPTRELVLQVSGEIAKFNSVYKVVSVYGGTSIEKQTTDISRGVAIIVATPGRLIDLLERKAINFKDLEVVCIDEADTMLEKGFKDDIEEIFGYIRGAAGKTQNIMFSATIPHWVTKIAREYFSKDMERINMIKDESVRTSETVEHYALYVKRHERHGAIRNLIEKYNPNSRTIIFTQTKAEANDFIKEFDSKHIVILHGDIPQSNREANLRDFRNGHKKLLIATDVAARGIDIPDVELIIQLSPPENPEPYIHRSGRTGRAGKEGINITFFD